MQTQYLLLMAILFVTTIPAAAANPPGKAGDDWRESLSGQWPGTDFSRRTVELDSIQLGGPPRDAIPAIDHPHFIDPDSATDWLAPLEPVVSVTLHGEARAYPLQILIWHEIVNDRFDTTPVTVTFCPLCNAAITFDRRLNGRTLNFGTTGKLRHSDLVMYDRQTESWWQQFTGEGIVGEYAGETLSRIPSSIISFADFRRFHPNGTVLSRRTGHSREYGQNPYRGYDRIGDQPFLLRGSADPRLPAMARVLGVLLDGQSFAYPLAGLREQSPLNDQLGQTAVVLFSESEAHSALGAGQIAQSRTVPSALLYRRQLGDRLLQFDRRDGQLVDRETGSTWNLLGQAIDGPLRGKQLQPIDAGVYFAFAWLVFYPETTIRHVPG